MSDDPPPEVVGALRLGRKSLDALSYAAVFVAVVVGVSAFFELSARGTLTGTKYVLFWFGFALLAYASLQLRPPPPGSSDDQSQSFTTAGDDRHRKASGTVGSRSLTRFERLVDVLPPMRWVDVAVDDRFTPHAKLFLAALLMLATSATMEFVFGVPG
ncbi:DUF7555 family protein [Haloarchaeobius sp. HRN-SO-5]|uniref:DUF7555 family protein n=1 Tax=Haloarchaeobius sp. HRN-SO-5 TaxID=3446118 RepID=UPI003EB816A1